MGKKADMSLSEIEKTPTGIPGFDYISAGGLPSNRVALLSGSAGSGKTIFACQFLHQGASAFDEGAVFVTFEEPPAAIRRNMAGLGIDIPALEAEGRWSFVDMSPQGPIDEIVGHFDLGGFLPRIEYAVRQTNARRLVIDSLGAVFAQFTDLGPVRRALREFVSSLERLGVTALFTAERAEEYGPVAQLGVEEFALDTVIVLRHVIDGDRRRRLIEVLKMRGASYQSGEYPFTIDREAGGLSVVPLSAIELNQSAYSERVRLGSPALDEMVGGGLFKGSVALVAGPTGTGKTLVGTHFLTVAPGERALLIAFEEGVAQLMRNAEGWGLSYREQMEEGLLQIDARYPETATLEQHLIRIKTVLDRHRPSRVVLDSVTALARGTTQRSLRQFLIALVAACRERGITTLLVANTRDLGGGLVSEADISSMTDAIILLRYFEVRGELQRGIRILKMRGSRQERYIRRYTIEDQGLVIGEPLNDMDVDGPGSRTIL